MFYFLINVHDINDVLIDVEVCLYHVHGTCERADLNMYISIWFHLNVWVFSKHQVSSFVWFVFIHIIYIHYDATQ